MAYLEVSRKGRGGGTESVLAKASGTSEGAAVSGGAAAAGSLCVISDNSHLLYTLGGKIETQGVYLDSGLLL